MTQGSRRGAVSRKSQIQVPAELQLFLLDKLFHLSGWDLSHLGPFLEWLFYPLHCLGGSKSREWYLEISVSQK